MKIYSVSTRCYFGFGALVSEDLCHKLKELPKVRWVFPDYYNYGGLKKGKRKPKDDSETEVNLKKPIKVNLKKPKKEDVIKEEILLCLRRIEVNLKKPIKVNLKKPKKEDVIKEEILLCLRLIETKLADRLDLVLNGLIVEVVVCYCILYFFLLL